MNGSIRIELGKNKLSRFRELEEMDRVYQPPFEEVHQRPYPLKGKWSREVFGNDHPLVLELGCGKGDYTIGLARMHPEHNFMGVDIKGARIWRGARTAQDESLGNVVFLRTRIDFILSFFGQEEVDEIWIPFPDPQEKVRRQKKRLTSAIFMNRYRHMLKDRGLIHLKTDNESLFTYTLELARYNHLEIERHSRDLYREEWTDASVTIQTYYESRFLEEGARICYLGLRLPSDREIKELPRVTR